MGGGGSRSGESMDEDESTTSPPEPAVSGFTSGIFASRLAAISDTFRLTNGGAAASEDGCRCKEFMASQHIQQDMVSIKTYLHRLRRILQDAETANLNSQNVSWEEEMSISPDSCMLISPLRNCRAFPMSCISRGKTRAAWTR